MPTQTIGIGNKVTLKQNQVYAFPAKHLFCTILGSGAPNISLDGTTFQAVTLGGNKQFDIGGGFIKMTTADADIICVPY
jgi:hypothetical protein